MTAQVWALALAAAAGLTAVFWFLKFRRVLPLEQALTEEAVRNKDLGAMAQELLSRHEPSRTPQLLADALQRGVDAFCERFPGVELLVFRRMALGAPFLREGEELLCRTGPLLSRDAESLNIPPSAWDAVPEDAEGSRPAEVFRPWSPPGFSSARLWPWGVPGKIWGLLGALEGEGSSDAIERHGRALEVLAAYFTSVAEGAASLWETRRERERLEGGLSATMRHLDEAQSTLVRRAKEFKTVQEVAEAISTQPSEPDVLAAIASTVAKAMEADVCAFLILDETTGELVTQPGGYGLSEDEGSLYRISLGDERSSSVRAFRTGQSFMTGDAQKDSRVLASYTRRWRCHSLMVAPLSIEGRRIGVMRVGSFKPEAFQESDLRFVQVIAREAAVLVESAMLTRKLGEMNRQLTQLHHLKDDFLSTVSHEFKTPLTSIQGFLSVILDGEAGPLTEDQHKFLLIAKRASERLRMLVADLLDLSRLEAGARMEFGPLDLADVAAPCVENHRWEAQRRGVSLSVEAPARLPPVLGDAKWLAQVFDNLISNAVKFTPSGGRVEVTLANKGDCVMTCVRDSGVGIPPEDQAHVFEKFYMGKNRGATHPPGTGLGLAICRSIVNQHEGKLWLESEPGRGSSFYFVLPTAKALPAGMAGDEDSGRSA